MVQKQLKCTEKKKWLKTFGILNNFWVWFYFMSVLYATERIVNENIISLIICIQRKITFLISNMQTTAYEL